MQHALLKRTSLFYFFFWEWRTSLINHKDSWCMHWTDRVFFPFAFKKGRKHWGYLWVSNSIGMLMLITRVGVILMEPTEFPLALKGQARNFYQSWLVVRSTSTKDRVGVILMEPTEFPLALKGQARNQRLDTSMLQNVSIHRDMDILMSNSIDWYKLTTTRVCPWKTIRNYFSMSPVFSTIFLLSIKFL